MNKFKNIVRVAVLAALVVGCEDATDIIQPGTLDASAAFQNVDDLEGGMLGAYNLIDRNAEIHFTSVFTDEIRIGFDSGGQGQSLYRFNLTAGNAGPSNLWTNNYRGLRRVNSVIEAANTLEVEMEDEARRDDILGQSLAIRAYYHFQLLQYMSTDLTDDSALGIPLVDFVPSTDFTPLRNTNGEVYAAIESDLSQATSLIADSGTAGSSFFTVDAVNALRARVAAYRGDYTTARNLAQPLVNAYPLADTTQYVDMFDDLDDTEVIMKLERTVNDSYDNQGNTGSSTNGGWAGAKYAFVSCGLQGSPYYEVATDLYDSMDNQDIRKTVVGTDEGFVGAAGRRVVTQSKYCGSEGQPLMNDHKIFRSSEMVLLLAEAAAASGNFDEVEDLLDDIRDARFGSDQADLDINSSSEAFGAILDERRFEFALEGRRYIDLKRLGSLGNRSVDRASEDCDPFGACNIQVTDTRFTWPLPLPEFNGNPGLRDQQNPGY